MVDLHLESGQGERFAALVAALFDDGAQFGSSVEGPRLYSWAWFGLLADRSLFLGGCPGCMHPSRVAKDHEFGRGLQYGR